MTSLKKNSLVIIGIFLLAYINSFIVSFFSRDPDVLTTMSIVAYFAGAAAIVTVYKAARFPFPLEQKKKSLPRILIWGILGVGLSVLLQNILIQLEVLFFGGQLTSENTENITSIIQSAPFFMIAVAICGPIMEEFVFRFALPNLIVNNLTNDSMPKSGLFWLAAVISSLIFAVFHFDGHYLLYTGLSLFFFWLYRHTGSIWTSVITHTCMNAVVIAARLALLN